MDTPLIIEELKKIEKSHGGSFYHWVGFLIHITVQVRYDLQYFTMHLIGHINSPTEHALIALRRGI